MYNTAALAASQQGPTAVASFDVWEIFCAWCKLNLNMHDREQRALTALESILVLLLHSKSLLSFVLKFFLKCRCTTGRRV